MDYLNINCTSNCIHQNDGKCTLEKLEVSFNIPFISDANCAYFKEKAKL